MARGCVLLAAAALLAQGPAAAQAPAQAKEQFVPAYFYWAGPYAPGGSGMAGGMLDYLRLLNERDGGINGIRFTWNGSTGATLVHPLPGAVTFSLIDKGTAERIPVVSIGYGRADAAYGRVFPYVFPLIATDWQKAAAMVRYMGEREGGLERLRGKKVALLYDDSAYGKAPVPVLTDLARKYGYRLSTIAVPRPGNEQGAQWDRIRELRPDWVILWGWGIMTSVALKTAARIGYPRSKMLGAAWSGAEEDVMPAGRAAKGFVAAGLNASGTDHPVIREIRRHVYEEGEGEMADLSRIGSIYYNRGVVFGIITAEAVRVAQERFGKGEPVTGEQVQWALEHLDIDERRLEALGAAGFMPPLRTSCADHEGAGVVRFMRWDGGAWDAITDWMAPMPEDARLVRSKYEESALRYARQKGIEPRDCPNA